MKIKHGLPLPAREKDLSCFILLSLWMQQDGSVASKVNIPGFDSLPRLFVFPVHRTKRGHVPQMYAN